MPKRCPACPWAASFPPIHQRRPSSSHGHCCGEGKSFGAQRRWLSYQRASHAALTPVGSAFSTAGFSILPAPAPSCPGSGKCANNECCFDDGVACTQARARALGPDTLRDSLQPHTSLILALGVLDRPTRDHATHTRTHIHTRTHDSARAHTHTHTHTRTAPCNWHRNRHRKEVRSADSDGTNTHCCLETDVAWARGQCALHPVDCPCFAAPCTALHLECMGRRGSHRPILRWGSGRAPCAWSLLRLVSRGVGARDTARPSLGTPRPSPGPPKYLLGGGGGGLLFPTHSPSGGGLQWPALFFPCFSGIFQIIGFSYQTQSRLGTCWSHQLIAACPLPNLKRRPRLLHAQSQC